MHARSATVRFEGENGSTVAYEARRDQTHNPDVRTHIVEDGARSQVQREHAFDSLFINTADIVHLKTRIETNPEALSRTSVDTRPNIRLGRKDSADNLS